MNPLDLPGPAFLAFYAAALIVAHFAGKALIKLCQSSRGGDDVLPDLPPLEAAYLAGGTERAVDMALVRLLRTDLIAPKAGGGGFELKGEKKPEHVELHELQHEVFRQIGSKNGDIERLRRLKSPFLARTEVRLANDGLLLARASAEALCVRSAKSLPFAAVIVLGMLKIGVGIARHRPVAFLVVFVVVSLVVLGFKWFGLPLRSAKGEQALKQLQRRNAALQTTVRRHGADLDDNSLMLAVALFGTQVLASDQLEWMQQGFVTRQSSSSDSGGGSSGGCGGGGGGGCGGCGG